MKSGWFERKVQEYASAEGYQKPTPARDSIKLDSNENYTIPKQFQQEIITGARKNSDVREYPLGLEAKLIKSISRFVGVCPEMIGIGNGSDQILDLILANFASKKTRVLTSDPTFGFFEERCRLYSIPQIKIPFSYNMKLNLEDFMRELNKADILYLDSPNNPTGFQFSKNNLQRLIRSFDGLVIIDEAYGQFGDYSIASMTKSQKNLIVVQTMSKSFGLAGLRLGYFIACRQFAETFNRVIQYPYPLSTISIESGILAMAKAQQMRNAAETVKSERRRIIENLRKYDAFEVFDSKANFVLFDASGAYKRVFTALSEQGISLRQLGKVGSHKGCLRVTIGTREMNSRFLLAVRDLLG